MPTVDLIRTVKFFISSDWASFRICMDWIWFLCLRIVRFILMYTTSVIIKLKAKLIVPRRSRVPRSPHNIIKERNALYTHMTITTITTRLWVTSSWYLRWRWTAKNLSTLTATTPRNEAPENKLFEIVRTCLALQLGLSSRSQLIRKKVYNGWLNKPTVTSVLALLKFCAWRRLSRYSTWRRCNQEKCSRHSWWYKSNEDLQVQWIWEKTSKTGYNTICSWFSLGAAISDKYWMGCDILAGQLLTSLTKDNMLVTCPFPSVNYWCRSGKYKNAFFITNQRNFFNSFMLLLH